MAEQIDLKQKSLVELKAMAYDFSSVINQYQQMIQAVNKEIAEKQELERQAQRQAVINESKKKGKPQPT